MNDRPPKFQFDIEETRFEEFLKRAEERLKANSDRVDYESTGKILFADLQPSAYLTHPMERPEPDNVDDEMASYALSFPDTMELYHTYNERKNGSAWQSNGIGLVSYLYYGLVRAGLYFGKIIRRSKTAGKNQQECPLQIKLFFLRLRILILSPLAFVAAKET